jgi:hypothetical protein
MQITPHPLSTGFAQSVDKRVEERTYDAWASADRRGLIQPQD